MSDTFMGVVVEVPEEHYVDGDDICLAAGRYVWSKLMPHLLEHGHVIEEWCRQPTEEDYGVVSESKLGETVFQYVIICYGNFVDEMMVQYHVRHPFLKFLFRKPPELAPDDPIHKTMEAFGQLFSKSRMVTVSEFAKEY